MSEIKNNTIFLLKYVNSCRPTKADFENFEKERNGERSKVKLDFSKEKNPPFFFINNKRGSE